MTYTPDQLTTLHQHKTKLNGIGTVLEVLATQVKESTAAIESVVMQTMGDQGPEPEPDLPSPEVTVEVRWPTDEELRTPNLTLEIKEEMPHLYLKERPDLPPLDLTVVSQDGSPLIRGIRTNGNVAGVLTLRDLEVTPLAHGHDFAAIRMESMAPAFKLVAHDITVSGAGGGWKGFGMKWGMVLMGCEASIEGVWFGPALEHSLYLMNMRDYTLNDCENGTLLKDGRVLGNGRTFFQHSNRLPNGGAGIGGPPSSGTHRILNCTASHCGHEGIEYGTPEGGSDFTYHGHTGVEVLMEGLTSYNPYCGSVAFWNPSADKLITTDNPYGLDAWQVSGGSLHDPSWSVDRATIKDLKVTRDGVPQGRTAVLISGVRDLRYDPSILSDAEFNHTKDNLPKIQTTTIL